MCKPKISIIIPVFNVEKHLKTCFESILNQTIGFEQLEVIFIDDCSTDMSRNIIEDFTNQYNNVKGIYLETNSGFAGKPRNIGIKNATSDYIMFLDPDDEYMEYTCEFLYEKITSNNLNFISGNFIELKNNEWIKLNWEGYDSRFKDDEKIFLNSISENPHLFKIPPSIWTKIFKRNFLIKNNIKFPEGIAAQDLVFTTECLIKTKEILYIDKTVTKYIKRNDSVTAQLSKKTLSSFIQAYELMYDLLNEFDEKLTWLAARNISSFWFESFIKSDLSWSDKLELLKRTEFLFDLFKRFPKHLKTSKNKKPFFEYCYNKQYNKALNYANLLHYLQNNDEQKKLLPKIKNFNLYFIFGNNNVLNFNKIKNLANALADDGFIINFIYLNDLKNDNISKNINQIFLNEIYNFKIKNEEVILFNENSELKFKNLLEFYQYCLIDITDGETTFIINYFDNKTNDFLKASRFDNIYNINICDVDFDYSQYRIHAIISKMKFDSFKGIQINLFDKRDIKKDFLKIITQIYVNHQFKIQYNLFYLKHNNRQLSNENKKLKSVNDSILKSSSWKITKPLRLIKNIFK